MAITVALMRDLGWSNATYDFDKDGDIEGDDLADLRASKNEARDSSGNEFPEFEDVKTAVKKIIQNNPQLIDAISLQLQPEPRFIFKNIITPEDRFAFTICNPPFHKSEEEANKGTLRKISNLNQQKTTKAVLNFGGQNGELWCDGGELKFITQMIYESSKYPLN